MVSVFIAMGVKHATLKTQLNALNASNLKCLLLKLRLVNNLPVLTLTAKFVLLEEFVKAALMDFLCLMEFVPLVLKDVNLVPHIQVYVILMFVC